MGDAYNINMKWISVVDRAHGLLSKGYNAIEDRLEPEVREQVGGALQTYSTRRKHLAAVDTTTRNVACALRESFPEYLA